MATADVLQTRPLRGSRISSFYPVKTLPALASLDSAFQLQEYVSLLIRRDVHDVDAIVSIPDSSNSKNNAEKDSNGATKQATKNDQDDDFKDDGRRDVTVDESCWIYEQLRRLAQDLSHPLITMLQQECTRATCPEMKAGEWLYLCVAHGNDGAMEQCCAIDYILHTLDSATALLNSPRAFPSRLQIPATSHRHFSSLARRLGRIFAHAYFHHREAFEQAEVESSLYARFLALTSKFDLVPAEFLVIPPRMMPEHDDEHNSDPSSSSSSGGAGGSQHPGAGGTARGGWREVQMPKLLGASIDGSYISRGGHSGAGEASEAPDMLDVHHGRSPPGLSGATSPGESSAPRGASPRKGGRTRTDTMVYSEAFSVAEELAKASANDNPSSHDGGEGEGGESSSSSSGENEEKSSSAYHAQFEDDEDMQGQLEMMRDGHYFEGDSMVPDSPLERTEYREPLGEQKAEEGAAGDAKQGEEADASEADVVTSSTTKEDESEGTTSEEETSTIPNPEEPTPSTDSSVPPPTDADAPTTSEEESDVPPAAEPAPADSESTASDVTLVDEGQVAALLDNLDNEEDNTEAETVVESESTESSTAPVEAASSSTESPSSSDTSSSVPPPVEAEEPAASLDDESAAPQAEAPQSNEDTAPAKGEEPSSAAASVDANEEDSSSAPSTTSSEETAPSEADSATPSDTTDALAEPLTEESKAVNPEAAEKVPTSTKTVETAEA